MSIRDDFLASALARYLARRSVPRGLADSERAQRDEIAALLDVLIRKAPTQGYEGWWQSVERHLGENAETRAWPDEAELAKAASAVARSMPATVKGSAPPMRTAVEIDEARILNGEPVSCYRLWGRGADEMLARGQVTLADLERYRKSLRHDWRRLYGEEEAARLERERVTGRAQIAGVFEPPSAGRGPRRMPGMDPAPRWRDQGETPPRYSETPRPYTPEEQARIARLRPAVEEAAE
jgi:hypothetical protein